MQEKQKKRFTPGSILLGGIAIISLFWFIDKGVTDYKKSKEFPDIDYRLPPPRMEVTAKQYYADYNANEVLADEKYKDKPLRITGRIRSISKGLSDDSYVLLPVSDYVNVRCDLANKTEGFNIKKGQKVTFDGIGNGMVLGDPLLKGCVVFVNP